MVPFQLPKCMWYISVMSIWQLSPFLPLHIAEELQASTCGFQGKVALSMGLGRVARLDWLWNNWKKFFCFFFRFLFMKEKIKGSWEKEKGKEEREEHETTTYWWLQYKTEKKSPLSQNPTSEFSVQQHSTQKRSRNGQEHVSWTWRSSRTGQGQNGCHDRPSSITGQVLILFPLCPFSFSYFPFLYILFVNLLFLPWLN